tara:strand:- start:164 stop:334 length:171 start_codon:yes stop_codon:yes gene_type:complete
MATYKLQKANPEVNLQCVIKNYDTEEIRIIPFKDGNTDYAEYLEWVAAGNTPEDAD